MDIKILHDADWKFATYFSTNYVMERTRQKSKFENIDIIRYFLIDINTNEHKEILPNIEKYDIGGVVNASLNPEYLYFTNIERNDKGEELFNIIRYCISTENMESIYSFSNKIELINTVQRYRIFIINDEAIILQNEELKLCKNDYSGYFKFNSFLINLKDGSEFIISDENIINNGITDIIAVSEKQCIIKTGFSLVEDGRFSNLTQEECSVETIGFVNISQMLSDLAIGHVNISIDVIDQAFYETTIPYMKITQNYLIYSVVNNKNKTEEIKFYNMETNEVKKCSNEDVNSSKDLANAFIINNNPYVCIEKNKSYQFLNINSNKVDHHYHNNLKLVKICKEALVFAGMKKSFLIGKEKNYYEVIGFPSDKVLFKENHEYIDSLESDDDTLYIITK